MAFVDNHVTLNTIRATASNAYQALVPVATATNITDVAEAVLSAPVTVQNEFAAALVNLIGKIIVDSVDFTNPFTEFKKGKLAFGSSIEHVYFNMVNALEYTAGTRTGDTAPDQYEVFKGEVHAAFYSAVLEAQYAITISHDDLKRAFYDQGGVNAFIENQWRAIKSTEQYDEYRMMVALIARQIELAKAGAEDVPATNSWNGYVKLVTDFNAKFTKTLTAATCLADKDFLAYATGEIRKWSKRLVFPRSDMNVAGVMNSISQDKQSLFLIGDVEGDLETYLLPWVMDNSTLKLNVVKNIDAWYTIGADDTSPVPTVAPDSIEMKASLIGDGTLPVVAVLFHKDMFQVWNQKDISDTAHNARGHYTNAFHTIGDIYAASPFHNFVAFSLE